MFKKYLVCLTLFLVTGCGMKIANDSFDVKEELVVNKYETLRKIVIEEAGNNGFSQLTSEIKPSKYNEQKGRLFFSLKTPMGTDQLFADFDKGNINVHGAGFRSNPESAIKAITIRIKELNDSYREKNPQAKSDTPTKSAESKQSASNDTILPLKPAEKNTEKKAISSESLPNPTSMTVTGNKAKIRKKPSTKADIVKSVKKGEVDQAE